MKKLEGKKTYLGLGLLFLLGGLFGLGVIDRDQFEAWAAMAAAFTGVGFRSAIK
jgi:hypothetical protein